VLREQFKYVTSKGVALAVAAAGSMFLGLLVLKVYEKFGSFSSLGVYNYILTIASLVGVTALSGMNAAILVAAAQGKRHILRSASRRRVKFSLFLGCPILLATGLVMLARSGQFTLPGYACLILVPLFPFLYSYTGVYTYLNGLNQVWQYAFAQIGAAFLNLAAVLVSLRFWPDFPILPPLAALALKTLFEFGLYAALVRRDRIPLSDQDAHLLSYGMKVTVIGVTGNFESNADRFIVGSFFPPSVMGMYSAGRAVILPLKQLPQIYYQLYAPKLARRRPAEAWRLTNRALAWGTAFFLSFLGVIFWLLPWFYTTFLKKFDESSMYARWFVVMVAAGIPFYFYSTLFESQRQARREIMVRISRTVLIILGLLIFIRYFGVIGVVYAEILATAAMSLHSWYEARKSRNVE